MNKLIIFTLGVLFPYTLLQAQTIEDYYASYNYYSACPDKKIIVAPWLLNGNLVEKGDGQILLSNGHNGCDTIPFFYYKGQMVFFHRDYDCLSSFEDSIVHSTSDTSSVVATMILNCIVKNKDTLKSVSFNTQFPVHWILCHYSSGHLWSTIYRITICTNGYYLVTLDTYGYYTYYGIPKDNHFDYWKRRLIRKHLKTYGRF